MPEWVTVLKAADAAALARASAPQGPAAEPYINHLLEVAMLVAQASQGNDPNL